MQYFLYMLHIFSSTISIRRGCPEIGTLFNIRCSTMITPGKFNHVTIMLQ